MKYICPICKFRVDEMLLLLHFYLIFGYFYWLYRFHYESGLIAFLCGQVQLFSFLYRLHFTWVSIPILVFILFYWNADNHFVFFDFLKDWIWGGLSSQFGFICVYILTFISNLCHVLFVQSVITNLMQQPWILWRHRLWVEVAVKENV